MLSGQMLSGCMYMSIKAIHAVLCSHRKKQSITGWYDETELLIAPVYVKHMVHKPLSMGVTIKR